MIPRLRWMSFFVFGVLLPSCNRSAGSNNPRAEARQVQAAPASGRHTAAEILMKKAAGIPARDLLRQGIIVDSARSAAQERVVYYWTRIAGRSFHEFHVISTARYGERYFDPGDLQAWSIIWGEWVPNSKNQALNVCLEAVAVGVANTPDRLERRDLLQLRTALHLVNPEDRSRVERAIEDPVIEQGPGTGEQWRVWFWYPDLDRPSRPGRVATRYLCEVPGSRAMDGFRVVELDSIVKVR
jgi:hypothetical protein